jgi:hypothetical protein
MSLTLVAVANRGNAIELTYEETIGDPQPFVLTVTQNHVASETSKPLPIGPSELDAYVRSHVTALTKTAERCKAKGLSSEILQ